MRAPRAARSTGCASTPFSRTAHRRRGRPAAARPALRRYSARMARQSAAAFAAGHLDEPRDVRLADGEDRRDAEHDEHRRLRARGLTVASAARARAKPRSSAPPRRDAPTSAERHEIAEDIVERSSLISNGPDAGAAQVGRESVLGVDADATSGCSSMMRSAIDANDATTGEFRRRRIVGKFRDADDRGRRR